MRVCIDLTAVNNHLSGIERFALCISSEMIKNRNINWILIFNNSIPEAFNNCGSNVKCIILHCKNKLFLNQVLLTIKLYCVEADCYFFPAFPVPFFFTKRNALSTIHDLSCWDCPQSNKFYMTWYFRLMYWHASIRGKKIVTVSEFSKNRICSKLNVLPDNIEVVYNGVDNRYNKQPLIESEKRELQQRYRIPSDFVLTLSTVEPRKNINVLLDAYSLLFKDGITEEIVIAGRKGWLVEDLLTGYSQDFLKHVHFTGFIADEDLPKVYKMSKAFLFPSKYEGFGLPPLEALACGSFVISSNATAMPEILGKSAVFFNPYQLDDLVKILRNFYSHGINAEPFVNNRFKWDIQSTRLTDYIIRNYQK